MNYELIRGLFYIGAAILFVVGLKMLNLAKNNFCN